MARKLIGVSGTVTNAIRRDPQNASAPPSAVIHLPRAKDQVSLVHENYAAPLTLPWWPGEVSRDLPVRTFTELERANLRPLTVPGALTNPTMSINYTARNRDYQESIQDHLSLLADMAGDPRPVTLYMGRDERGQWHIESVNVQELEWADSGHPSVVDISLNLKRATDVTINVGLIKRKRNRKPPKNDQIGTQSTNKKTVKYAKQFARDYMQKRYSWGDTQFAALEKLWDHESGWDYNVKNQSSGAYGIPQALPASKMATAGSDWKTNPDTQIKWGLGYIKDTYGTPVQAWQHFQNNNWY